MKCVKRAAAALIVVLLLCGAALADVTVSAQLGYEGVITYLTPMPLRVTLENTGADAELTVAVNVNRSDREYDRYEYPVSLAGGARMELTLPLQVNYRQSAFTVEVLSGDQLLTQAAVTPRKIVAPSTLLVGVISDAPAALSYLNINTANDTLLRGDVWQTVALDAASFPADIDLLRAFRILAVDGVDVSAFTAAQQAALTQWLREGGIVLVGGGSTASLSAKGFAALTGVLPGAPYRAQGVDQALADALADSQFALTAQPGTAGNALLCDLMGTQTAVATLGDKPLIVRSPVGQGVVYTTAFSLAEKPLSAWEGMAGFWQRALLTWDRAAYAAVMNDLNNYYNWNDGQYADDYLLRQLPIENEHSLLPAVLVAAACVLLAGLGSYALLRRLDKREWMWLTVPLLSLAGAMVLVSMGAKLGLNRPAMAAYTVVRLDADGAPATTVMAGVAASDRGSLTLSASDGSRIIPGNDYSSGYYQEEETDAPREKTLRYRYTKGAVPALTLPASAPWTPRTVQITPKSAVACAISAAVWWEEDGLHGQIVNRNDYALEPGWVLTSSGYCSVPRLLPGQEYAFAILENPDRPTVDAPIRDGELITGYTEGMYSVLYAAVYPEDADRENSYDHSWMDAETMRERQVLYSLLSACMNRWSGYALFRYVTFSDTLGQVDLLVNGEPIRRTAQGTVIDVAMDYRVVGNSGIVRLTRGMVPAYRGEVTGGLPASTGVQQEVYAFYSLRDEPVVCFAPGEVPGLNLADLEITGAELYFECYGATARVQVYDASAGRWQEYQPAGSLLVLDGAAVRRSLDENGYLYVRFSQAGGTGGEIDNPVLTLEGRVR